MRLSLGPSANVTLAEAPGRARMGRGMCRVSRRTAKPMDEGVIQACPDRGKEGHHAARPCGGGSRDVCRWEHVGGSHAHLSNPQAQLHRERRPQEQLMSMTRWKAAACGRRWDGVVRVPLAVGESAAGFVVHAEVGASGGARFASRVGWGRSGIHRPRQA